MSLSEEERKAIVDYRIERAQKFFMSEQASLLQKRVDWLRKCLTYGKKVIMMILCMWMAMKSLPLFLK